MMCSSSDRDVPPVENVIVVHAIQCKYKIKVCNRKSAQPSKVMHCITSCLVKI